MKILLLGGTGAMGAHLAQVLADRGDWVHITSRRKFDAKPNICYIQGNAHDLEFISNLLDSCKYDCVVDFMVYDTLEFLDRVHLLLSKSTHYVFLSSSRVYASKSEPLREDSPRLLDISKDK